MALLTGPFSCSCVCLLAGTKHKTILEARSGLGPIKAYPRLGPKPIGEQGGGPVDPNTQERTFHCEICNVRVNSELQLKQVGGRRYGGYLTTLNSHVDSVMLTSTFHYSTCQRELMVYTVSVHRKHLKYLMFRFLCSFLSAHIKSKTPGWHGRKAQPSPEPTQEAQGR